MGTTIRVNPVDPDVAEGILSLRSREFNTGNSLDSPVKKEILYPDKLFKSCCCCYGWVGVCKGGGGEEGAVDFV